MQEYRMRWQGGLPTALWASLGLFALAVLLFVVFSALYYIFILAGLASLACFIGFPWQASHTVVSVSGHEIRKRQGTLFRVTRRLPRRFVTGTSLFATPLQRALGVCCFLVHTSGTFLLLLGLDRKDAELLGRALGALDP